MTTTATITMSSSPQEEEVDQQNQTTQQETTSATTTSTKYFQSALILLLSTNLLVMTALSCGYDRPSFHFDSSSSSSSSSSQTQQQTQQQQQRRNLRTNPTNNNYNPNPSYYYSHFINNESHRTLYRKSILNGSVATVGAQLNAEDLLTSSSSSSSSSSSQQRQPYEWTKEGIPCPTPPSLHSTIPQHYSECFLLINVASGDRLYAEDYNDVVVVNNENNENAPQARAEAIVLGRIGSVPSNTPITDNQIWLNEYPLSYNNNNNANNDLVTIRHAITGRRLYADADASAASDDGITTTTTTTTTVAPPDLSVGFGVSHPATIDPPKPNEIWKEIVQYKYTNIL